MGLLDTFAGQISQDGTLTPAGQGLLAAGLGILAHNRGLTSGTQALGMGGMEGLQAYQGAKQQGMAQQLQNAQLQNLGFQLKKQQLLYDTAQGLLNPGAASVAGQPAPDTNVGAAPGVGSMDGMPPAVSPVTGAPMPQASPASFGTQPQATAPAPAAQGSPLFGNIPRNLAGFGLLMDPNKLFEIAANQYAPTDFQKSLTAAGVKQGSPEWNAAMTEYINKQKRIEPTSLRPGAPYIGSDGLVHTTPSAAPAGFQNTTSDNGKTWQTVETPGSLSAIRASRAAEAGGGAQYRLEKVWDPTANGGQGGYVNQTVANVADAANLRPDERAVVQTESNGNPNAVSPKGAMGVWQVMPNTNANPGFGVAPARDNSRAELDRVGKDYYNAMTQRYGSPTLGAVAYNMGPGATDKWLANGAHWEMLPAETRNYVGKTSTLTALNSIPQTSQRGPMAAEPPLGAQAGAQAAATNAQSELSKKWTALSEQNTQAQTTNSYLQSIKGLAAKAATGQQADRINYVNGLLSLAGSEKATDAVTANNLLDKYSNQIVARLGQGGLGTDAARSILQSAYPNAHMTPDAIHEAADNLIGANQMTQAKARLLAPFANDRNSTAYNNAEMAFDRNADPRIFQYANIQDPAARAAFAKKLQQQDPKIVDKMRALQSMGAL